MKVYVFGNPVVRQDSIPLKLLPELKKRFPKIDFIITDPNENFPSAGEKDLVILDTVLGISEPTILNFEDLEDFKKSPVSPHDYDLLFHLVLLKKMNKIHTVFIIGIPNRKNINKVIVIEIIDKLIGK